MSFLAALLSGILDRELRVAAQRRPGAAERLHALEVGTIDGYDLGSLTIHQAKPPMDELLVRQAVAHGLDRRAGRRGRPASRCSPAPQAFGSLVG